MYLKTRAIINLPALVYSVDISLSIIVLCHANMGGDTMYEMRRRKPDPTLLLTQGTFSLAHHTGLVLEELAFDDALDLHYTQQVKGLQQLLRQ